MKVLLSSVGNPDFGQNPNEQLWGAEPNRVVDINSFEEASAECTSFIHHNQLGSGNWTGGKVTDNNGNVIATVSYNGRVWKPRKKGEPWTTPSVAIEIDKEKVSKMLGGLK